MACPDPVEGNRNYSRDATRIRLDTYSGCEQGVSVVLYTVGGSDHTWPGGSQYAPQFVIGRVSRDLNAGEAIWGFFMLPAHLA